MNAAQIFTMPLAGAVMPEMAATDTTAAASTVSDADIFGSLFGNMLDNQAEQKESASAENTELQKQPEFKTVLPKQLDTRLLMQEEAGAVQMAEMVSAAFTAYQQPVVQDDVVEDAEQLQDKTVEATTPKVEATTPKVEVITRQPVQEQQETTQNNKPATAWWGYEKPVQQQATVNDVNQPQHPAQTAKADDIQPKSVGQQTTAVTAESTEPAVKDVTRLQTVEAAIEKSDNSNTHNLAASGNTNRIHAEAVSQPEKGAETNRQATQEQQVYKQFSDQLSKHDFKQGAERVSFTLHPENLGKLHLNFQMEQQNLRVEIVAENRIARDSLMQQIDQVKESLARQNINLEKFDVSTSDGRMFQQHQQPSQQRNLYGSLYGHQPGSNKAVNGNGTATADGYQLSDAVQYFAPQYESTFNYQA